MQRIKIKVLSECDPKEKKGPGQKANRELRIVLNSIMQEFHSCDAAWL